MSRRLNTRLPWLLLGVACLLHCKRESGEEVADRDWQAACKANSVPAYKSFLDTHPDSRRSADALQRLGNLEWEKLNQDSAKSGQHISAREAYMRAYPQSEHLLEALVRYESTSWKAGRTANAIDFVTEFRDGELKAGTLEHRAFSVVACSLIRKDIAAYFGLMSQASSVTHFCGEAPAKELKWSDPKTKSDAPDALAMRRLDIYSKIGTNLVFCGGKLRVFKKPVSPPPGSGFIQGRRLPSTEEEFVSEGNAAPGAVIRLADGKEYVATGKLKKADFRLPRTGERHVECDTLWKRKK